MSYTNRVKIKPRNGTVDDSTKIALATVVQVALEVKFNTILSLKEAFIFVCHDDAEAEKLLTTEATTTLTAQGFTVTSSPALRARKSVFLKKLDKILTSQSTAELKSSIETQNTWATVDSITKIPNATSMLKVTFTDVNMAATALNEGLAVYYCISPTYIEARDTTTFNIAGTVIHTITPPKHVQ
nr:uncharacterized protein LOC128687426 isoform X2 [Cherax quadricarinatus]